MKNSFFMFWALIFALFIISCKENQNAETETETVKQWLPDEVRDIPALSVKRGLIKNTDLATPGYIMFHPSAGTSTYLMNLEGQIVHEWKGELCTMLSYLQDNGNVIRHARDPDFPTFAAGGQSGRIQEYTWDGQLVWNFEYAGIDHLTHHDIEVLPNGNILAIAYEVKSAEEAIAAGRKTELTAKAGLWPDVIIEIEPTRPEGGNIVWEWHMWDHLIQDHDPALDNYGSLSENPRKININVGHPQPPMTQEQLEGMKAQGMVTSNGTVDNQGSDITHTNGIDYNAELDQIVLSVPGFGEVFIIDHSTTTEEARGSTGGRWGHGGDLLYRWGNPQNYGQGGQQDQKLFGQHDARWIPEGRPHAGSIMVFNNDKPSSRSAIYHNAFEAFGAVQSPNISIADLANHSQVAVFNPPQNADGSYTQIENSAFGPTGLTWSYVPKDTFSFYAPFVSSAHPMQSGNVFVNSGPRGRLMEITQDGDIVWEYWNPYNQQYRLPDGSLAQPTGPFLFYQFRVEHIPVDHPALSGRDLQPLQPQPEVFVPPPPPSG